MKNVFFNFLILWHFVVNTQMLGRSEVFLIALGKINYFPEIPLFYTFTSKDFPKGSELTTEIRLSNIQLSNYTYLQDLLSKLYV